MPEFDHPADGEVVVTVIGSDGVRWACRVCRATVFLRDNTWHHFGETVDALPTPPRRPLDGEFIDTEENPDA